MIEQEIAQTLFRHRKIAYLVINSQLEIESMGGQIDLLDLSSVPIGELVRDVVPELIGFEEHMESIIAGNLSDLHIRMVNREMTPGEIIYLNLGTYPHHDSDGNIVGMLHIAEDVTELGRLEQEVTQERNDFALRNAELNHLHQKIIAKNAELMRLDEIKSRFVSIAAHELRSPLTSITGYADMLNDASFGTLNPQQHQFVEIIERSAMRLLGITNNLLDVTRMESGRLSLVMQPIDPTSLLEQAAEELHPLTQTKQQKIVLDIDPDISYVLCDEERTLQILMNLISNACKYTPEGGTITIQIQAYEETGFIQFSIQDTGIGISQEDQKQLFDTFFRAGNAHVTGASGAGLGLNITRSLVELHGGRIWFESKEKVGSTFYFTLHSAEDTEC